MTTLKLAFIAMFFCVCAACTSRSNEQATSPTSPEDQVVPSGSADSVRMDSLNQRSDTTSLRR
ncbi:MAG: hypothetical protein QM762_09620 [Chryseolinea sp.]